MCRVNKSTTDFRTILFKIKWSLDNAWFWLPHDFKKVVKSRGSQEMAVMV